MNNNLIVKENYTGKKYNDLPIKGSLSPEINKFVYMMKALGFSINAIRIVIILSANLYEQQNPFKDKKRKNKQLDLFDDEWMNVDNDKAFAVQLRFKFSDFLPEGSKNTKLIKTALDELQEKSHLLEFTRIDKSGKERNMKLKSALISAYILEEGYGFKIIINNFWYRALIDVSKRFNQFSKSIIFNLNENAMIMYFYLLTLDYISEKDKIIYSSVLNSSENLPILNSKKLRGTKKNKEDFQSLFLTNYKYDSKIKEKILEPLRNELNKKSNISFNYKIEGNNIVLVTYDVTKNEIEQNIYGVEESKILKAINNIISKRKLTETQTFMILEMYLKYTYKIIAEATHRKSILRGKIEQEFVDTFDALIKIYLKRKNNFGKEDSYNEEDIIELRKKIRSKIKIK